MFCLSASAASATADCGPVPSLGVEEIKALPVDEWRAYNIRNWESFICRWTGHFALPERYRPPADADYVEAALSSFHESLTVAKNRRTIPPVDRYLERFREPSRMAPTGELFTYSMLSGDIYREDNCPVPKQGKYCIPNSFLAQQEAAGKNGRAEIARLARESRIPPIDPWFLVGKVTIKLSPDVEQERRDLVNRQREAKEDYDYFKSRRDEVQKELAAANRSRANNIKERNRKPAKLIEKIADLEKNAKPDPAAVRTGQRFKELGGQIEKARKRQTTIKGRIKHLQSNRPETDSFARDRISALEAEARVLKAREVRWQSERAGLFAPKMTNTQIDKLKKLKDDYRLERADADRRIAVENRRLGRVQTRADRADAKFRDAETELAAADAALARWQRPNMAKIDRILTEDAEVVVAGERAIKGLVALNKLIFKLEREQIGRKRLMNGAQTKTDDARFRVKKTAQELASAEKWSIASQYAIEAGSILSDVGKAYSSAGPVGALLESVRQELTLLLFPPSFVTTDAKNAPAPDLGNLDSYDFQAIEVKDMSTWGKRFGKQVAKQIMSYPYKVANKGVETVWNKAQIDVLHKSLLGETPEIADRIAKHQKRLDEATKKLSAMNPKNLGKFSLWAAGDFAKGVGKSLAKDQLKQLASDVMAKPALQEFMKAQLAFAMALVKYQVAIDDYWLHQNMIEGLRAERDQLRDRLDPDNGTVTVKNEPFFADPYYAFRVFFEEGVEPAELRLRVTFGDIELVRDGDNPLWAMPEDARTRFGRDLPEDLPLVLQFE